MRNFKFFHTHLIRVQFDRPSVFFDIWISCFSMNVFTLTRWESVPNLPNSLRSIILLVTDFYVWARTRNDAGSHMCEWTPNFFFFYYFLFFWVEYKMSWIDSFKNIHNIFFNLPGVQCINLKIHLLEHFFP